MGIWNKFKSLTLYCTLYQKDKRNEPFDEMYSLDFIKNKAKILSKIQVKNGKKYRDYYDLIYDDIYTFFKKYNAETDEYIINKTINELSCCTMNIRQRRKHLKNIMRLWHQNDSRGLLL